MSGWTKIFWSYCTRDTNYIEILSCSSELFSKVVFFHNTSVKKTKKKLDSSFNPNSGRLEAHVTSETSTKWNSKWPEDKQIFYRKVVYLIDSLALSKWEVRAFAMARAPPSFIIVAYSRRGMYNQREKYNQWPFRGLFSYVKNFFFRFFSFCILNFPQFALRNKEKKFKKNFFTGEKLS
jgi:hypothetical protein